MHIVPSLTWLGLDAGWLDGWMAVTEGDRVCAEPYFAVRKSKEL